MKMLIKLAVLAIFSSILVACDEPAFTTSSVNGLGAVVSQTEEGVKIGFGVGSAFSEGVLSIGDPSLPAGGSTSVIANLVDTLNTPYTKSVTVNFSSACSGTGAATLDTDIETTSGTATSTYVASGCSGPDIITASATITSLVDDGNGGTTVSTQTISAQASLTVSPAAIGAINFVSATPTTIGIKGTGGATLQETSTVIFKVVDESGGAVANQTVSFALDTTVGGISITPVSALTSAVGTVQTVVSSGTIHTSVKITATTLDAATATTLTTQSDALVISTGVPDQNSFSISTSDFNPRGGDFDGTVVSINIYAADHFNNPVPDGTTIAFTTEGGHIKDNCSTVKGACKVDWVSQVPRPPYGRVTILATAIGNESYLDLNGNGQLDDVDTTNGPTTAFDITNDLVDLPEAFRDDNENGIQDIATEEILDFNNDGVYSADDNLFNGISCIHTTLCSPTTSIHVRASIVLNMATASNFVALYKQTDVDADITNNLITPFPIGALPPTAIAVSSLDVTVDTRYVLYVFGGIYSGQPQYPVTGTSISIAVTNGELVSKGSHTVQNVNGGLQHDRVTFADIFDVNGQPPPALWSVGVTIIPEGLSSSDGILTITATSGAFESSVAYDITD
ncbi:MAG: hypothetical protein ACC707_00870 [Thiohalomonadales bacterium]